MEAITIYSTGWCPDCRRVKHFLKERGVEFQEVNIEQDEAAEEIVMLANHGKRNRIVKQAVAKCRASIPVTLAALHPEEQYRHRRQYAVRPS